ncbi:Endonuclease/exonuclease/phosphatase [Thelonectria olida]|uniref:Endonuclease/exonuclease/phosphatase n=1 Tax=Thelonectria olida TaxID=1576542 RepID=A0A9P8WJT0_9HYPO|nr:Endonuclease/exonuclease/phosphatase [Thelonectria olida]
MRCPSLAASLLSFAVAGASAQSIAEINGKQFLSPYKDQAVTDVTGLVTAKSSSGFWLRSTTPDKNSATSEGLYVYGSKAVSSVAVGDIVSLGGTVKEYRSAPAYLYLTELTSPTNITVKSSNNTVAPLVIGVDTLSPPRKQFSKLDGGDIFGVPNNQSLVSTTNPKLQPGTYGLDFWESLVGELVTVRDAYAVSRANQYGDVWVRGDWKVSGLNGHGGLTMLDGDANPEAIRIIDPVDGSDNPTDIKLGDYMGDITGIVFQAYGFYSIQPLTAVAVSEAADPEFPAVTFTSKGSCKGITVADYNAENLNPASTHLPLVVDQIVHKLLTPDLIFLQEVQDNTGATNNGVVSANETLIALADGIEEASGVAYDYVDIDPVNNQDGGQPGGNIRVAYLYRPDRVALVDVNPGNATQANEVLDGAKLKYNPGLIDPSNSAWSNSRKPLVAKWKPVSGTSKPFFTINVHFGSKGGSSSLHGDPRPPVNEDVDKRTEQAKLAASFIAEIRAADKDAHIITAGDFNEFVQVEPLQTFLAVSGLMDLDEAAKIPEVERYTYLYDMNCEALDHMFISKNLRTGVKYEHMHVNTWQDDDSQVSDHDPSVARFNLC